VQEGFSASEFGFRLQGYLHGKELFSVPVVFSVRTFVLLTCLSRFEATIS
jgi:hypothetical protein